MIDYSGMSRGDRTLEVEFKISKWNFPIGVKVHSILGRYY